MQYKNVLTSTLVPYERNPRRNDQAVDAVAASIREFGFKVPIVIDRDNVVVAGHTRLKAALKLGLKTVPVIVADDLMPEQIKAFRLADNKTAELAEWDLDLLDLELGDIEMDMEPFGFELGADESQQTVEDDFDPEPPTEPKAKRGEIYQLGRHRLMCGDSTDEVSIRKLMDGKKAKLLLTDPPYGIKADKGFSGAEGFNGKGKPIERRHYEDGWDSERPSKIAIETILQQADQAIIFGGNFFTDLLPVGNHWLVWDKHNTMPTFSDAELAWTNIKRNSVKLYDVEWNGLIGKEKERYHPTQKPIKLLADIISNYTEQGQRVADFYGGSGSTLIACEQTERKCYMMELDPRYIDVIIDRWEKLTGEKAVLVSE